MSDDEARAWLDGQEAYELFGPALPAVREIARAAQRSEGDDDVWLTTGEAAQVLNLSVPQVRRMVDGGVLVAKRVRTEDEPREDRFGRKLYGHRRVTLASVMEVKSARETSRPDPSSDTLDT